jgi:uncharacterized protein (DUF2236 family)
MTTLLNPSGVAWRVHREAVLLLGGRRALLMQIAHPAVAAAVADHSDFKRDPFGRLRRTVETMFTLAFGTPADAQAAYRRVDSVHGGVRGEIPASAGTTAALYDARDPELLLWVQATLIDTALVVHRRFVGSLDTREAECFYQESKTIARLFGIPDALIPAGLREFRAYVRRMIEGGPVRVSDTARELARPILYPPVPLVPAFAFDAINIVTIGLMPAPLRAQFALAWNPACALLFDAATTAIALTVPLLPDFVRAVPAARAAERALR